MAGTVACGSRVHNNGGGNSPSATTNGAGNTASDVGVSTDTVNVGLIVTKTGPFGDEAFSGAYYGATAYWDDVNRRGGIHGRKVKVFFCDDHGNGSDNVACVHQLVDQDHVFALAGTAVFSYDGASYLNSKGVPDVGGQPVDNSYDQYAHLWSLLGSDEPRNGQIGWDGKLYTGTETPHWFKVNRGTKNAAVVFYNVAPSQRYARGLLEATLKAEGYTVREEQVDLALANFDSVAVDMANAHVDSVYDALDVSGNARLCKAMDAHHVKVAAKVTTTEGWVQTVGSDYAQSPTCRNSLYATGMSRNYADTQYPAVKQFRDAVHRLYPDRDGHLSEWELESWAGAQWLGDAMTTCGAQLTRACVENFLRTTKNYTGHDLLTPRDFTVMRPGPTIHNCLDVVQWQDSANDGNGGWVTRVKDMDTDCFDVPNLPYQP